MDLPISLVAVFVSLFVAFIGLFLALRAGRQRAAPTLTKRHDQDGSVVMVAGRDAGGSRKSPSDPDGRDSNDGDAGGGDGGGGGGD